MVNSIEEFDKYMSTSANSVEWDVDFDANGTAVKTFHGAPCDCLRKCNESAPFADYLDYIREAVSLGEKTFSSSTHFVERCFKKAGQVSFVRQKRVSVFIQVMLGRLALLNRVVFRQRR